MPCRDSARQSRSLERGEQTSEHALGRVPRKTTCLARTDTATTIRGATPLVLAGPVFANTNTDPRRGVGQYEPEPVEEGRWRRARIRRAHKDEFLDNISRMGEKAEDGRTAEEGAR